MILPDVNLLIHAHNADSPVHDAARRWWDDLLAGTVGVGLAWIVMLGFIRITTHRSILANPLPVTDVLDRLGSWLALPQVHVAAPSCRHYNLLRNLLGNLGTAGNLTTDAHLAALAIGRGYQLHSTDTDFARFPALKWRNPLQV
ncbi:MAG: PIN domain-containing protein [Spirochaetaceae bacterium]|nr:PIN domain-containing protein [Spirochaetaceae bacterium]